MARYRTAIIACGTIARVHARAWLGIPDQPVALGALADTHPDARREFGDFFGIPEDRRYANFREMLDAEQPDFVDVCSWHQQHAEMVIAAAARRPKAILCQKPMAVDLGTGATILIQGHLVNGLGQGCRVIGSDGVMELDTARPADADIPSDAPMYMPEGPSARYNAEIGVVRYFNTTTNGWIQVEAG